MLGEEALRVESTAGAEAVLAATARLDIDPGAEPWAVARAPDERDLEPVRRRGDVSQQPVRPARERWDAPAGGEQQVEPAVAVEIREVRPAPPPLGGWHAGGGRETPVTVVQIEEVRLVGSFDAALHDVEVQVAVVVDVGQGDRLTVATLGERAHRLDERPVAAVQVEAVGLPRAPGSCAVERRCGEPRTDESDEAPGTVPTEGPTTSLGCQRRSVRELDALVVERRWRRLIGAFDPDHDPLPAGNGEHERTRA